jgi:hypothetical protein
LVAQIGQCRDPCSHVHPQTRPQIGPGREPPQTGERALVVALHANADDEMIGQRSEQHRRILLQSQQILQRIERIVEAAGRHLELCPGFPARRLDQHVCFDESLCQRRSIFAQKPRVGQTTQFSAMRWRRCATGF